MDLIHVEPLLGIKLLLLLLYTGLWYVIYGCFHFINKNDQIKLDMITAFFYLTNSPMLIMVLVYQAIIGQHEYWPIHIHLVLAGVAFYVFAVLEEFRIREKYEWDVIVHHLTFGTFFFVFAINLEYAVVWCWLYITQVSGIFYSLGRSLKKHNPSYYTRVQNGLEITNYWFFLFSRVIYQTGIMIYLSFWLIEHKPTNYISNTIIITSFFLSFALNINWFAHISKRYRATKERMQLSQS